MTLEEMMKLEERAEEWAGESLAAAMVKAVEGKTTAAAYASAIFEAVKAASKAYGQKPDIECFMQNPAECEKAGYGNNWRVCWESGPYEWAIGASMALTGTGRLVEPYYSFDLCISNETFTPRKGNA